MAQYSYRYNPIMGALGYWRVDISWRTDGASDHLFYDEWTGGITNETAGSYTHYKISGIKAPGRGEAEIQMLDSVSFEFETDPEIVAALDPSNAEAAIRVWYSADNSVWQPMFWGDIDLNNVQREREAQIGSTWIKLLKFTAYDSLRRLNEYPFNLYTDMVLTSYHVTTLAIAIGTRDVSSVMGSFDGAMQTVQPKNLTSGNTELMALRLWLEQSARCCYHEQRLYSTGVDLAFYGYSGTVDSPVQFIAHTDNTSTPGTITRGFRDAYVFWNVFGAEWYSEFDSLAEWLAHLAEGLGFAVSTRHTLVGTPAKWVRSIQYSRLDGQNGLTLTPGGVLLKSTETTARRMSRRVVATTRYPSGAGVEIPDYVYGAGEELNLTTHFRTIGAEGLDDHNDQLTGPNKQNTLWHTLVIYDSGVIYRPVQQVKVTVDGTDYEFPQVPSYEAWQASEIKYSGWAQALAWWFYNVVTGPGRRSTIEETYSDLSVQNGTSYLPSNWRPYALIGDQEYSGTDYKVLEYELNPDTGEVRIVKELAE